MKCPKCGAHNIRVLESRSAEAGQSVRRRRECSECTYRFTTYERIEFVPIMVIKRDKSRESFDTSKILRGITRACEKTQVSVIAMESLVEAISERLHLADINEISSADIGEMVLAGLQELSEVAYVRFASVYRKFQGVRDFVDELGHLVEPGSAPAAKAGKPAAPEYQSSSLDEELKQRIEAISRG